MNTVHRCVVRFKDPLCFPNLFQNSGRDIHGYHHQLPRVWALAVDACGAQYQRSGQKKSALYQRYCSHAPVKQYKDADLVECFVIVCAMRGRGL